MAGHSKWANIRHRKGAQDAARSKIFAKFAKEIFVAAKKGGDPDSNPSLRLAISKAKAKSMPAKNIQKAIDKASGNNDSGANFKEYIFEGYAPGGVSLMINCLSDNNNRITSNLKSIFTKGGGEMGKTGSVSYLFDRLGILEFNQNELNEDEAMMISLEAGASDFKLEDNVFTATTIPKEFQIVKDAMEKAGIIEFITAEIMMVPNQFILLNNEKANKILTLIDKFEDDDDVQEVFHNLDLKSFE
jgi:YebC/PmpR family DNA-binding regulatory protein